MGLFDFFRRLKQKRAVDAVLEKAPTLMRAVLREEFRGVREKIEGLRAAHREKEANEALLKYIRGVFDAWKKHPSEPGFLTDIADVTILMGVPFVGKELLVEIASESEWSADLDRTSICLAVGKLCHQLRTPPEEEYKFYKLAIDALAPHGGKPASMRMKAKAHLFAVGPAQRMSRPDLVQHHEACMRQLAPDVNFDDRMEKVRFVQETRE
jgi:hypothetical protein